jgi:acetyl-CoA acetyltransferase
MTRAPWGDFRNSHSFLAAMPEMFDSSFGWRFINPAMKELYGVDAMGETAENLAERDGISRADQDLFALRPSKKPLPHGRTVVWHREIVPVRASAGGGCRPV